MPQRVRGTPFPATLTRLVGRERELALAAQLLRRDEVRLLTVTGPGGIGKTRLALEIARELAPAYPDGVTFVPLAVVSDGDGIVSAMMRAIGLPDAVGVAGEEGLVAALRSSCALVILDNFEHLLPDAPLVSSLLAACPRLTIVVTSRSLLRIAGEYALPVPPLLLPDPDPTGSVETIGSSPAVKLFVERVQAISPEFALSEQTARDVAGICRHLDGLPLAIELAAAQMNVLPPAALLARIRAKLPLPVPGPRDAPVRLRTISDAVAWSYDLLTEPEQQLFRRLSVFTGGFMLDAAEALTSPGALAGIASLVDKNLLQPSNRDGDARFVMLETIRSFAQERLAAHGEQERMAEAHAAWALALVEPAEFATAFPGHEALLRRMEGEHANLLAAMTWLDREGDVERLLRFSTALGQYWITNGHVREARFWLERVLARSAGSPAALRGRAQVYLGRILSFFGEAERADQLMAEGIAALRAGDLPAVTTFALFHRSAIANQLGEYDRAEQILNEARAMASTIPDPTLSATAIASVVANLGVAAHGRGDLMAARARYEEALSICRQYDFTHGTIRALRDLGDVDRDRGEYASSVAWYQACLELLGPQVNLHIAVDALEGTALAAAVWQQPAQAARLLGAADAFRERYGGAFIVPADRDAHDRTLARIRSALSEAELATAWQSGRCLTIADAIAEMQALDPGAHQNGAVALASVRLSPREREVLTRLAAGYSDRAIADELFLSVRTVEAHVARILTKFEVRSRTAAVSAARAAGLVQPEHGASPAP